MKGQWIKLEDYKLKVQERLYVVCEAESSINGEVIKYQTMAEYVPPMTIKEEDFMDSDCWGTSDYNENNEEYYASEGFYEWQSETDTHWKISAKVTHVMPLFELP